MDNAASSEGAGVVEPAVPCVGPSMVLAIFETWEVALEGQRSTESEQAEKGRFER